MLFDSWVILYFCARKITFNSIMCINKPQICPIISISFYVSASKNRSYKFSSTQPLIFCLAVSQYLVSFFC